jgi:hypothetical protein
MPAIREPSREIPIVDEVDVLVVGGGPAGIAAATAAARAGARTTLVERYGYLGGMATGGLVLYMDGLFDRQGERCIGGLQWEALERLRAIGGLAEDTSTSLHVDSELFKVVADEMCTESGATLRLHSWAVDALHHNRSVTGVVVESKSGREAILSRACVDATGDGDIAARAGADYDCATMRIGLNVKVGGVDREAFRAFEKENPEGARDLPAEVTALGGCPLGLGSTPHSDVGVYWVNVLGLAGRGAPQRGAEALVWDFAGQLSATDVEALTYAEVELRRRILKGLDFYRQNVPGYENARLLAFAPQLCVRDSRRVRGVHTLTKAEAQAGGEFADAIGMTGETYGSGRHLQVPYRSLLPEHLNGLLVSGRCISVDDGLIHAIRLIAPCMMTGQAAGTAAALAVEADVAPRDLDVGSLRAQLASDGAILPR